MVPQLSPAARRIATQWSDAHQYTRSACVIRGFARQVQDHLDHGADPEHLRRVAIWMAFETPGAQDIDLAMRFSASPKPAIPARQGHPCACRGGSGNTGGAPAPAMLRQLIRRQLASV